MNGRVSFFSKISKLSLTKSVIVVKNLNAQNIIKGMTASPAPSLRLCSNDLEFDGKYKNP